MSVEFDIKILRPVLWGALLASAESVLADLFADQLLLVSETPVDSMLGDSEQNIDCRIDHETVVTVIVHKAGDERGLGAEGGYWLTVAADRVRSGRSAVLALLLAAAAAQVIGTNAVDEWLIVGTQREVSPIKVAEFVRSLAEAGSFQTTARILAARLDIAPT